MTSTRDIIAKLPKERQERLKKEIESELKEYQQNENTNIKKVNQDLEKYID